MPHARASRQTQPLPVSHKPGQERNLKQQPSKFGPARTAGPSLKKACPCLFVPILKVNGVDLLLAQDTKRGWRLGPLRVPPTPYSCHLLTAICQLALLTALVEKCRAVWGREGRDGFMRRCGDNNNHKEHTLIFLRGLPDVLCPVGPARVEIEHRNTYIIKLGIYLA